MDFEKVKDAIYGAPSMSTALGMEFVSTPDEDTCVGTMKVDERNRQPFGLLSGGASLALAETLAGIGSLALCDGKVGLGINISGSHVKAVREGDTVTATAKIMHKGHTLHQWHVEIRDTAGDIISIVEVTNFITELKKK